MACSLVSFLLCCYDLFCRQLACFCCWSWSSFLALEVVFRTTPVPLWPQFCLLVLWQLLTLCSSFGTQFCLRPIFPSSGTSDPSSCVDSCRVCSGYVLCSGLDLAPAPVNLVSHKASGLCGGAWPHTSPSSASLDNANGWVSPYSPLPNLGNTCYIAAVLQMIRALGVAFPCSGDSWHATVQCLEQLGLHDGLQKDSRCFFGILVAQYPTWARQFSWLFGRQASCSTCGSVRDLPVDEQSVVDLPLVPGASHCLSTLLDTAMSSGEASLDCAACAGRKHHTLSGLSVANVRSSVFFHVRRSANGAKSRSIVRIPSSIVWFGRTFHLTAAVIHIGDAPDAGQYTSPFCRRRPLLRLVGLVWMMVGPTPWLSLALRGGIWIVMPLCFCSLPLVTPFRLLLLLPYRLLLLLLVVFRLCALTTTSIRAFLCKL